MTIYCTYLTVYSGSKLPPFYIGSTSLSKIEAGYRGTVSSMKYKIIWKKELKENPHLFKTRVITLHKSRKDATVREYLFQKTLGVVQSSMYINMAVAAPNGFFGMDNSGIPKSESMRKKLSGNQNAKGNHKPKSETHKKKIKESLVGRVRSKEHAKAISEAKKGGSWWNKDGTTKMFKTTPPEGWTKGWSKCRYSSSSSSSGS